MTLEQAIKHAVCGYYKIPESQMIEKKLCKSGKMKIRRDTTTVLCRYLCFYFFREVYDRRDIVLANLSNYLLGIKQDHTTVLHGIGFVKSQLEVDKKFALVFLEIKDSINEAMGIDDETRPISILVNRYVEISEEMEQLIPYNNCANF